MRVETLRRVLVVTISKSLYELIAERNENACPLARKIRKDSMLRSPGQWKKPKALNKCLEGGNCIAITPPGLMMYTTPDLTRILPIEMIRGQHHSEKTSPIAAIFLDEKDANGCLDHIQETRGRLCQCDNRWYKQTLEALQMIGYGHPVFTLSETRDLRFPRYLLPRIAAA